MITLIQYVGRHAGSPDWTAECQHNAVELLLKCADLEELMKTEGIHFPDNPVTQTGVSGNVFGGFRPKSCPQGSEHSSHKEGRGVDRYDPNNFIDDWLANDYRKCVAENREQDSALVKCGLYIEHPNSTPGWSHWTDRAPPSGNRIFLP